MAWYFVGILTESRIEHVKRHLVAFRSSSDSHESLVAVVLRLVDLDHAAAELSYLIDLGSTFPNDCSNHIVRNEDLLRQGLTRYHSLHWLSWWSSMAVSRLVTAMWDRLMRPSSRITMLRRAAVMCWRLWRLLLLRRLPVKVGDTVRIGWCTLWLVVVALVIIRMAVVPPCRLRNVRDNLHPSRDNACWSTATGSICRCCWSAEALCQLFYQCLAYVIGSDVDSVGNS